MPGIVGLITKRPRESAEPELQRMLGAILHDPSYTVGTWVDESLGVYVGWALRKGSFFNAMPIISELGDVVRVFSGEEYADPAAVTNIRPHGQSQDWVALLNGRFQGLSVDRRTGLTTLFNDRSGMHRIYYHESDDAFYFAVEAKAILAARPDLRRLDPQGLGEYLSCGCVLENRTLFAAIHVLPPASAWDFRHGSLEQKRTYFHPREWEEQGELGPDLYYETLRDVFARSLPRYFSGGGRIGMSLTGGLDTRMIMAWWKAPSGSIPCYSFAGTYRDSHDVRLGRQLAELWGQPYERIEVGKAFLAKFPEYAQRTVFVTDGCADVGSSPILYTNERARAIAPNRMTGNYGGEVLRGSRMFKPEEPLPGLFAQELTHHITQTRNTYAKLSGLHPVTFAVFRQAPWFHYALFALEGTQLSVRSPFLDNDLVRTAYRAPRSAFSDGTVCLRLIADGDAAMRKIRTDRGVGNAGLHGLVSRALLEFSFKAEYGYNHGMPQWLARLDRVLSPFQPERLFLGRHKYSHFRVWYRGPLAEYIKAVLLDARTLQRSYVNGPVLQRIVEDHVKGVGNYTFEIHKVLTLELLHRSLLDGPMTANRPAPLLRGESATV